jgi:N-acetyl sugar amidotransferase
MKYCSRCVVPYTRPGIRFDAQGNCNCARAEDKDRIDWAERERLFREVVGHARSRARPNGYDCLVPVSGGKDSTWQVVKCLEHGLKPLCVTWRPPGRTAIGQANLDNLVALGVDHVDYSVSPRVEKLFTLRAFERFGSTAIPMHMAIFAIPLAVAVRFGIPLVVWGENSAFEYGGDDEQRTGFKLDRAWLARHGVTHGTTARDWVGAELTEKELAPYFGPTDEELEEAGTLAIFLGYYFRWDPRTTYEVARAHGFRAGDAARTGFYEFADVDDDFISIHHWLKWYKFGFTRTFDNLSLEIRNGRMTREEAVAAIRARGDETPHADIEKLCAWLGITKERFFAIAETFRNGDVWKKRDGKWQIEGFLVDDWRWT